jgi:hypothetical protein
MNDISGGYIALVSDRLLANGFKVMNASEKNEWHVFRKKRFEFSKMSIVDTCVIITQIEKVDWLGLRRFSTEAFSFSENTMSSFPPCGFFAGLECYPLAVVKNLDHSTISSLQHEYPPEHMAAAETPAAYVTDTSHLAYFEETPSWGRFYWEGRRGFIRKFFTSTGASEGTFLAN